MIHFSFLNSPEAQALGYTLVYSLWQSFIVFICLRLVLKFISNASARLKYAISYFAHLGIATWFIITFFRQLSIQQSEYFSNQIIQQGNFHQQFSDQSSVISGGFSLSFLHNYFPLLAVIYLIGIVWFSIKLMLNYFQTIRFRINGLSDPDSVWMDHIWELADKMEIRRKIYAYFSRNISTPMMVGFFRPMILLPLAAINNLSPDQMEAILLHELAHIRRNDYFFNLVQSVIDTILFFNPFAWWISKNIREEREKCCDEVVLKLSDPYPYARALLALEELGNNNQTLVMASINSRSQLLHRIKNIMEMKNKPVNLSRKLIALAIVIFAAISVAWLTPNEKKISSKNNEIKKPDKSLFTVNKKLAPFIFRNDNMLSASISDSDHPIVVAPPPPPVPLVPPVAPNPQLPLPPAPPIPPIAPLPPSVSMDGFKDSIPSLEKFFKSDEWKKQQAEIQKSGEKMKQYFNSDEWKKQMDDIEKNTASIQKYFSSPEWKKQMDEIKKSTRSIQKYFNSPEWKQQQEEIRKNADKMKQYFNSDEWKQQLEEIQKNTGNIQKYFNSPEWKKQQDEIKKNADKIKQYFNSDEWKKQQDELKHTTDSIKAYFNSDLWKKQQENLQEVMAKTKKITQNDVWRKQMTDPLTIELKNTLNNLIEIQDEPQPKKK